MVAAGCQGLGVSGQAGFLRVGPDLAYSPDNPRRMHTPTANKTQGDSYDAFHIGGSSGFDALLFRL